MKVDDYMVVLDMGSADVIPRHKIDVTLIAEGYNDLVDTVDVLKRAYASNGGGLYLALLCRFPKRFSVAEMLLQSSGRMEQRPRSS